MRNLLIILASYLIISGAVLFLGGGALFLFCQQDATVTSVSDIRETGDELDEFSRILYNNYYREDVTVTCNNEEYTASIDGGKEDAFPAVGDTIRVCCNFSKDEVVTTKYVRECIFDGIISLVFGLFVLCFGFFDEFL